MPELPLSKRQPLSAPAAVTPAQSAAGEYAELHCRSNFSFLQAASHSDELVAQAARLGLTAIAITDRETLSGAVRTHVAARECGLRTVVGAELDPVDGPPLVAWCENRSGYGNLARMITRARRRARKGDSHLLFSDVLELSASLVLGIRTLSRTAQPTGLPAGTEQLAHAYPQSVCVMLEPAYDGQDAQYWGRLAELAGASGLPILAAGNVSFHEPQRQALQDVLTAIRHGCTVDQLGYRRAAHGQQCVRAASEMCELFASFPEAVEYSLVVTDRCRFSLDELKYEYPDEPCPPGLDAAQYLRKLTWEGARRRYPRGVPQHVRRLIEHELRLIHELNYEPYFLTVWDLVRFARSRNILCQGRGSAANSAVCFCLGVTSVDPEQIDVLFERFVSRERDEAPDIDVDFEHERREEVIQYLYEKYGRERAGMTAEFITYRARSAVRDVGKALGFSIDRVDLLARQVDNTADPDTLTERFADAGLDARSGAAERFRDLVQQILGFPRHLSQHVGGMVMTRGALCELVPIENAAMNQQQAVRRREQDAGAGPEDELDVDRTVVQWDKDDLEDLGILKVDCLALGMLTAIRKCLRFVTQQDGQRLNLATIPAEDPNVYAMIQQADTMGVFQIESRAQMSMLPRLKPACFYDLVIEVAIVRPGPIQGDMVHPYLKRRNGGERVEYPDERVRQVLEKTLGVPIFQEQAMRLAVVAAGFSPGEADQLRRAMGAWRRPGVIDEFRHKLVRGLKANGYDDDFAQRLFRQIRGFGEYGFPESHAASFALLVYVSAWLKCYYPAAFAAALLNSQPMGFYAPAQLIADARRHGVQVLPIDVNHSQWDCTLEMTRPPANRSGQGEVQLRLGFRMIRGLRAREIERLCEVRRQAEFQSFSDLADRTRLSQSVLSLLARADVFRSLDVHRRSALWAALAERPSGRLLDGVAAEACPRQLPDMSDYDEVVADYRSVGLSLKGHPFRFLRDALRRKQVVRSSMLSQLPHGRPVRVAGLVLLRQRPSTAKGVTFVTLEDEAGFANLIIRPEVWERNRRVARTARAMVALGQLQRQDRIIHVLVDSLEDMTDCLSDLAARSRDFR